MAEGFQFKVSEFVKVWHETHDSPVLSKGKSPLKKRSPRLMSSFEWPEETTDSSLAKA